MDKKELIEIKKGQTGTGLLIENDGYISPDFAGNKKLFEDIDAARKSGDEFYCPHPFIVSAVFQKYGIENANGRIYPESVLKREVEKYMQKIHEKRGIGECYRPEAMILAESGWKQLKDIKIGENILTLNPETNEIEVKPVLNIIKKQFDGNMVRLSGRSINDLVTPEHSYPLFNRENKFKKFITAKELLTDDSVAHYYIPKTGKWEGKNDEYFTIPAMTEEEIAGIHKKDLREKYLHPLVIPMEIFAKFMGIYLSEGSHSKETSKSNKINIHQKKEEVCIEIEKMLDEWGIKYTINEKTNGTKTYVISDMRLCKYVQQFGLCYNKFVPIELKQQNKDILRTFYDWFVMGDGRIRGDKRRTGNKSLSDDVFSTSERLTLDLNEIQLKIGYSGNLLKEERNNDRLIEGRLIKGENSHPMYFTYRSLTKGIYVDKRFLSVTEEPYSGEVMCVEVENHIWYVMDNGKCHWTKNCNHPSESTIDLSRVAINIIDLRWEGRTLVGELEVITSPGFRKHGIISCEGDQVANLLLSGIKIGVSSRGLGSVTNKMGVLYVDDDYEIVCWDVVSDPSTPGAWISDSYEKLQPYLESKESEKTRLLEKLSKFDNWLNG